MTNANHFPCGWQNRGVGIKTNNALFTVDKFGITDLSDFEGFHYGIQAYVGTFPWNGLRVSNSTFDKNKVAMFFNNTCFHDVSDCQINVGNTTGIAILDDFSQEPEGSEYYEGICQLKGAYFTCADNTFSGGNGTQQKIGLRIRSTKAEDNSFLHNNSFSGFHYANKADGKNFKSIGSDFPSGLRYSCQFNTANLYDFDVNGFAGDLQKGIGKNQNGYDMDAQQTDFQAAGSTFSGAGVMSHFYNNGDHDMTYFARPTNPVPTVGVVGVNNYVNPLVDNQDCNPYTNLVVGGAGSSTTLAQLPTWKGNMTWVKPQITQTEYLIASLIDGGNTEVLGDIIDWSNDTWAMRNQLLALSPYLSKQTLVSVANNTVLFPHPVALEIFVANPDVLRDNRFIEYLSTKADPMPGYMINMLLASRDVNTLRTLLDEQLAAQRAYMGYHAGLVGRALLRDPQAELAEMAVMMNQSDNLYDRFTLINWMAESGQTAEALAAYVALPQNLRIAEPDEIAEYAAFGNWLALRSQMIQDNITWPVAGPSILTGLCDQAALYDTWAGTNGIGVGNDVFGVNWFVPPAFSQAWSLRSATAADELGQLVTVYPNPAGQLVNFVFDLPLDLQSPVALVVYDIMGRPMGQHMIAHRDAMVTLDISAYPSGLYAYEVALYYGLKINGRFVVQH